MTKQNNVQGGLTAIALGGLEEIGLNMMAYECDGDIILVDAGLTFPDEFAPGVDIIIPDIKYLRDNIKKLKAIFITHAHEDHIGALPYIWEEIPVPVYVSQFSRCVLEGKMEQFNLDPAVYEIVTADHGEKYKVGNFEVEYIHVTHSIPGAAILAIRTKYGTVVNTGDYKLDESPVLGSASNVERMKEIGDEGVLAMFGDSTTIFSGGRVPSESDLSESLDSIVAGVKNRVFFTPFASNFERILNVTKIAAKHNRKVCFFGRSLQNMVSYATKCGMFPKELEQHVIGSHDVAKHPRENVLIFATGSQGQTNAAVSRLSNGEAFRGVQIEKDDTVIFSARKIPGNEKDIYRLMNRLCVIEANVISENDGAFVHVSGHACQDEVEEMYKLIRPQIAVPAYGEIQHIKRHAELAKSFGVKQVVRMGNGQILHLAPEEAKIIGKVKTGRNYVDGLNILDDDKFVLKERRKMSFDGLVVANIVIDKQSKSITGSPMVKSKGLVDEQVQSDLLRFAEEEIERKLANAFQDGHIEDVKLAERLIGQAARKAFQQERGRKPVVVASVIEV